MIDIGRTVGPLICAGQRGGSVMFVEAFSRNDGMFQIGRQCLKPRCNIVPVIQRGLQGRRDMRCVGIPSEIIGNDNQMTVTPRL